MRTDIWVAPPKQRGRSRPYGRPITDKEDVAVSSFEPERIDTVVIGGGQAGLSVGYHLTRRGIPFVILDANDRIGHAWRSRWDSLRVFTPARFCGLDGMPYPADDGFYFPTKDEIGDYLEAYAAHFELPVRLGVEVDRLSRKGDSFMVAAGDELFEADNVVVAMGTDQKGVVPSFASELSSDIVQFHSSLYQRPSQLQEGAVLVVGAANSGAEIALDVAMSHPVWLSGRHPGHVPFDIEGFAARHLLARLVLKGLFHRILTVHTPIGRKARPKLLGKGMPLVRTKPKDTARAGIERVPRVVGVRDGLPLLEDDRVLDVENVIWSTGYEPGFSWIDLDIFDGAEPRHHSGIVEEIPGLYFVGLTFLHAASSGQFFGVGRDAARIADAVADRERHLSASATR